MKNKHFGQNESCETGICDSGFGNFSGFRLKRKYNFCLVALLAVAMCFFVSCGGKSSSGESVSNFGKLGQECYPNKSCDGSLLCDEETNRCIEDPENPINDENGNKNDENNPIENNDGDKPIEHDDDNGNHEHNDEGNIVDENDNDPMEDNDNVVIPDDKDDVDEINDNDVISNECSPENILFTTEQTEGHSIEEFQGSINNKHNVNRSYCSYGSFTEKEKIDINGNLCIEDECNIGSNDIAAAGNGVWIDNLPFLASNTPSNGLPPPSDIVYFRKVEKLNKAGPTDFTAKYRLMTVYVKDVPTVSCFAPNNVIDDASIITMTPTTVGDKGCYADGQLISPSDIITTKNIQPKITAGEFRKACIKVPDSTYDPSEEKCRTTITEFAWLENVLSYLNNKSGTNWNKDLALINTKTEYDLNNNVFRMYFSDGELLSWIVELPNAKRCLDECYGTDGCEVSITPTPDVSKGCIVKEP